MLTWENFAAGRIAGSVREGADETVNAQLELHRNGDFVARSNDVETVYRRVIPTNPISPINPEDPDNPGMPVRPYGPVQDLSAIGETNAYCWVDIVVNDADACGGCSAAGCYVYEGYSLPAWGGSCGCGGGGEEDESHGEEPQGDPSSVGVWASFSKKVIFLENEYANTPDEVVPWYSDTSSLCCSANGGPHGGHVRIELSGASNLIQLGGEVLPLERELEPFEGVAFTNAYRAVSESGSYEDIVVTATFEENETGWCETVMDRATAVRVEIKPQVLAPENESENRHRFGIGETVECRNFPNIPQLEWVRVGSGVLRNKAAQVEYVCSMHAENNVVKVRLQGEEFTPSVAVIQPIAVFAKNVGYISKNLGPGHAGGVLLAMTLHALPLDVSFSGVKMEEVPDGNATHTGYFADVFFMGEWYHGPDQHAGIWGTVFGENQFLSDEAGFKVELPQLDNQGAVSWQGTCGWSIGTLGWQVLCGWAGTDVEKGEEPMGTFATDAWQMMTIDALGNCEVQKHANTLRRTIGGQIILNGEVME